MRCYLAAMVKQFVTKFCTAKLDTRSHKSSSFSKQLYSQTWDCVTQIKPFFIKRLLEWNKSCTFSLKLKLHLIPHHMKQFFTHTKVPLTPYHINHTGFFLLHITWIMQYFNKKKLCAWLITWIMQFFIKKLCLTPHHVNQAALRESRCDIR